VHKICTGFAAQIPQRAQDVAFAAVIPAVMKHRSRRLAEIRALKSTIPDCLTSDSWWLAAPLLRPVRKAVSAPSMMIEESELDEHSLDRTNPAGNRAAY
jgi:hypothetical protein